MMRRLMSFLVRVGGAERGNGKERDGQNESDPCQRSDRSVHLDLLLVKAPCAERLSFCASPSSTIRISIADVLLMRPRWRGVYSRVLGNVFGLLAARDPTRVEIFSAQCNGFGSVCSVVDSSHGRRGSVAGPSPRRNASTNSA